MKKKRLYLTRKPSLWWKKTLLNPKAMLYVLECIIGIIIIVFLVQKVREYQSLRSGATAGQATLFINPETATVPPATSVKLFVTTDTGLAFAHVELTFDPQVIQLTQEVTLANPSLTRIVRKTSLADANRTGTMVLAIGLDPASRTTPPSGTIHLATLSFTAITEQPEAHGSITIQTNTTQLIAINALPFAITANGCELRLNPATATPTPLPTVTPTPTPRSSDTIPPSIVFTNPLNGSTVARNSMLYLQAAVTDNGGAAAIAKVEFYINNTLKCSDTAAPYTCNWKVPGKRNASYTLEGVAVDAAGNQASSKIGVVVGQ